MRAETLWAQKQQELDAEETKLLRKLRAVRKAREALDATIQLARGLDAANEPTPET